MLLFPGELNEIISEKLQQELPGLMIQSRKKETTARCGQTKRIIIIYIRNRTKTGRFSACLAKNCRFTIPLPTGII